MDSKQLYIRGTRDLSRLRGLSTGLVIYDDYQEVEPSIPIIFESLSGLKPIPKDALVFDEID